MKFRKSFRMEIAGTLPEWEGEFISYKELKKQLKMIGHEESRRSAELDIVREEIGFMELLNSELEKVNTFFVEKEEEYIIRFKELKDKVENQESNGDMAEVKLDILEFDGEMVLLLHYSVLNFAGLLKIIKKHNKKTGTVICFAFHA